MKNTKYINVAIVGCGRIAKKHANIISSKKIRQLKLVAVCDTNKLKAKKFGEEFKIQFFENIDLLLKKIQIDLVVICSSSGQHYKNAISVSKFKKNVIIEKPISLDLISAKKIIKKFNKNKNMLSVVMQNRFNPALKLLKESIEKNYLGKITTVSIKVWWCRDQNYYNEAKWRGSWDFDGGIFMNQAIHHLDMIIWLMGSVKSVSAAIKRRLAKIETEDVGVATIEFKNGVLGIIEASTAVRPKNLENSITVLGEYGNIKIGGNYMNEIEIFDLRNEKKAKTLLKKYATKIKKNLNNHFLFYQDFVKNLLKNKKQYIDGMEAIKSLELATAIYESSIKRKSIYLPLKSDLKKNKLKLKNILKN